MFTSCLKAGFILCLGSAAAMAARQDLGAAEAPPVPGEIRARFTDTSQEPSTNPPAATPTPNQVPPATPPAVQPAQIPSQPPTPTSPLAASSPIAPPATAAQRFSFQPGAVGTTRGLSRGSNFVMLGDLGPLMSRRVVALQNPGLPQPFPPPRPPAVPGEGRQFATMLAPTLRTIKISENQSPRPQDRIYYSFNYFDGVNDAVNDRFNPPVNNMRVYRSIWGFEKTFNEGLGSIGLRLPLNTIVADQTISRSFGNFGGTNSSLGNLEIIGKYVLLENVETGNLLSGGLVIAPPTGPANFAGANYFQSFNSTTFQPFLGYVWGQGDFFLQGFSGMAIPTDDRDVTLMYNDVGVGYFLKRVESDEIDDLITMVAPTFEVHVNTPLNHRGAFDPFDPAATPDIVNLTYGLNVGFRQNALLSVGFVTPVTGPQPFDFEFMALLNIYFGGTRATQVPPVLGGF